MLEIPTQRECVDFKCPEEKQTENMYLRTGCSQHEGKRCKEIIGESTNQENIIPAGYLMKDVILVFLALDN